MGRPLQFDTATSRFEPLKYANVQVELAYSSPKPDYVWVIVLNAIGVEEKEKIEVQYPQLPYSCSLCKCFVHSLARCINNPDRDRKRPRMSRPGSTTTTFASTSNSATNQPHVSKEEYLQNMEIVPYVVGEFCGCNVVMDEDDILKELEKGNDLEEFDRLPTDLMPLRQDFNFVENDDMPIAMDNGFAALTDLAEDHHIEVDQSPGSKRKKGKSPVKTNCLEVVLNIPKPHKLHGKPIVDDAGFTHVSNRKSPRLAGLSTSNKQTLMMNFGMWNVRGLNKSSHQKEVTNFISVNNISLIGLVETKVRVQNSLAISRCINKNWNWLFNYKHHDYGRVCVG